MDSGGRPDDGVLRLIDMKLETVMDNFGPSGVPGRSDGYGSYAAMHNPSGLAFFPDGDRSSHLFGSTTYMNPLFFLDTSTLRLYLHY